ncbi:eIF-2-alpha kinase activator GCN1-like isoform X2 [Plutella xylostella]|nr:eIF-2-alpha kinase activator GCN1-like isoform X2 [Plutella xylostella]
MADTEVLKKLKDVPFKIQTASLKERRQVVKEIQDVLSSPGITEPAVRYICRVLTLTLHRYRDTTSQSYIKQLLTYLAVSHRDNTLKSFPPALLEISDVLKSTGSSKNTCQSGLIALRWSTILVEHALKEPAQDFDYKTIILAQANLLCTVTAYGDHKRNDKAYTLLHHAWSTIGAAQTARWLETLLAQAPDAGPQLPVAFSALCRHLKQAGDEAVASEHKAKMLESFIKSVISVKARPNSNYIAGCSALLRQLDPRDVQAALLPALQKSMLRSPETIIEAVGAVVEALDVKLDGVIVDIGKSLIGNLHSKDAWVRSGALRSLERVSSACADEAQARALLDHVFAVYNGASGKLTSSEDKIAVLNGAKVLSSHCTATTGDALWAATCAGAARVLEGETHERTLAAALALLPPARALPPPLLALLEKNLSNMKLNPLVRIAYTQLAARAPSPKVHDSLVKAVDRAVQQPLQHLVVSEGICAMSALVAQDTARALPARPALWAALTHADKHVLLQDRILAAAPEDVLIQVVLLCRNVLENYPSVASEKNSPVYRALILTLLSTVKPVRTAAIENVKQLLAKKEKAQMTRYLVAKLNEVLEEGKIFVSKEKTPTEEKGSEVTGKIILDGIHAICAFKEYPEEDLQNIAIDALRCCHHPLAAAQDKRAWARLVKYLGLEPRRLVALYANNLKNTYICGFTPTETISNVVSTLIATNAAATAACAVQCALDVLRDPSLLRVTRDQYFTYLMPEGELYDKSAVPG